MKDESHKGLNDLVVQNEKEDLFRSSEEDLKQK